MGAVLHTPVNSRSWREIVIRQVWAKGGNRYSKSQCMAAGCKQPPEVECVWADGRGRAWHCEKHHDVWSKVDTDDGLPKAIVKQRRIPNGIVGDKYGEYPEAKKASSETELTVDRLLALYRQASASDGKKTGYRDSVGLFIPLPDELAKQFPSLAPTDNSPPHVTFLFIGNVHPEQDGLLLETIHKVFSSGLPTIKAKLTGLDYFVHPDKDRRVAHCPVVFNRGMSELRDRLRSALEDVGIEVGDSFPVYRPHVTLEYLPDTKAEYEGPVPFGFWEFDEIEVWGLPKVHTVSFKSGRTAKNKIPGGLGDKKKPSDFDPEQIAKGVEVEMEHTDDESLAQEIAMDHLTEDPRYYDKLETIEKHASKYDHINFKPPASVANAAKKGLEYRKKQGEDKAGLTPEEASKEGIGSGVQRATNLKNRDTVSPKVIKQMVAFFSRHEKNKSIAPEHKNEPWKDKGHVSWLLWGGDPGKTWAEKILKQMESADTRSKKAFVAEDGWDLLGNHHMVLWPETLDEEGLINGPVRSSFESAGYQTSRVTGGHTGYLGVEFSTSRLDPNRLVEAYLDRPMPSSLRKTAGYFEVGDVVLFGKYKNKRGKVVGMGKDEKGNPFIEVEPIPKGRKKNKTISVLKVWHENPEKRAEIKDDPHVPTEFEELMQQEVGPSLEDSVTMLVAKYKEKHEDKDGNVHYEYSKKQVQHRDRKKAERIEKLKKAMPKLRKKVRRDLSSKDPKTKLTALVVALMDETYERVGNDTSAEDGHFGVTGWQAEHVSFGGKGATIKYTGKSGVKHEKKVTSPALIKALREAVSDKDKTAKIFGYKCEAGDSCVSSGDVNEYLKEFGITAKDIRGYHANDEMLERLKALRNKGPSPLPYSRKEKDEILKKEFEKALAETAEVVGHEPSTLKKDYLVPGVYDSYVHDGTVMESFMKKGTKDQYEKETESARGLVKKEPKKKPPRDDLRRRRVRDEEDDPDLKKPNATNDPDLSHNYKGRNARAGKKLQPIQADGFMGGTFYRMDVRDDKFVHFTPSSRALEIVRSKKLLMNPPYKKFGIDAVTAVSLTYGKAVPSVQTTHIKTDEELVAIVFKTNAVPDVGYVEEVIWKRNVPLSNVKILPASRAISMLSNTPERIGNNDQVYYEGSSHLNRLGDLNSRAAALALQYIVAADVPDWAEGKTFPHKTEKGDTTQVGWKSLTPEEQAKYQKKHEKKDKSKGEKKKDEREDGAETDGKAKEDPGNPELTVENLASDPGSSRLLWEAAKGDKEGPPTPKELADLYEHARGARITEETAQKILDMRRDHGDSATLSEAIEVREKKVVSDILSKAGIQLPALKDRLQSMDSEDKKQLIEAMESTESDYLGSPVTSELASKLAKTHDVEVTAEDLPDDPSELGQYLAERAYTQHVVLNPLMAGGRAVSDEEKSSEELQSRASEALETFRDLESDARSRAAEVLVDRLGEVPEDSHEAKELNALLDGVTLASALHGESTPGRPPPSSLFTEVAKSLENQGELSMLTKAVDPNSTEGRDALRKGIEGMTNEVMADTLKGTPIFDLLGERLMNASDNDTAEAIRQIMTDLATDDIQFVDPMIRDGLEAKGKKEKANNPKNREAFRKEIHKDAFGKTSIPDDLGSAETRKRLRFGVLQQALVKVKKWLGSAKSMAVTQVEKAIEADEPDLLDVPAAKPVARPTEGGGKSKKGSQSRAYNPSQLSEGPSLLKKRGMIEHKSPRSIRRNMMSKLLTKKGAEQILDHAGRLAHVIEHNWESLGIPSEKHAKDLAYRLDVFSETVERKASDDEVKIAARSKEAEVQGAIPSPTVGEGTIKDDDGTRLQGGVPEQDNMQSVPNGYDPSEIGKIKPPSVQEPDEPYMDAFTQDEFHQLADLQQSGGFSNAKAAFANAAKALAQAAATL